MGIYLDPDTDNTGFNLVLSKRFLSSHKPLNLYTVKTKQYKKLKSKQYLSNIAITICYKVYITRDEEKFWRYKFYLKKN